MDTQNACRINLFPRCIDIGEYLGVIDWSKVQVDTPIYVREYKENAWEKRYFAFFKNGRVHAWVGGATSWTSNGGVDTFSWNYAKLAEV